MVRPKKVWCDEDTTGWQAGDYYVDCMGSWIIEADGSWRPWAKWTDEERIECSAIVLANLAARDIGDDE